MIDPQPTRRRVIRFKVADHFKRRRRPRWLPLKGVLFWRRFDAMDPKRHPKIRMIRA